MATSAGGTTKVTRENWLPWALCTVIACTVCTGQPDGASSRPRAPPAKAARAPAGVSTTTPVSPLYSPSLVVVGGDQQRPAGVPLAFLGVTGHGPASQRSTSRAPPAHPVRTAPVAAQQSVLVEHGQCRGGVPGPGRG